MTRAELVRAIEPERMRPATAACAMHHGDVLHQPWRSSDSPPSADMPLSPSSTKHGSSAEHVDAKDESALAQRRRDATMTTKLERELKREITIDGTAYTVTLSPVSITLVLKGRRKGLEINWVDLVSGEAALATALNASLVANLSPNADSHAKPQASGKISSGRKP